MTGRRCSIGPDAVARSSKPSRTPKRTNLLLRPPLPRLERDLFPSTPELANGSAFGLEGESRAIASNTDGSDLAGTPQLVSPASLPLLPLRQGHHARPASAAEDVFIRSRPPARHAGVCESRAARPSVSTSSLRSSAFRVGPERRPGSKPRTTAPAAPPPRRWGARRQSDRPGLRGRPRGAGGDRSRRLRLRPEGPGWQRRPQAGCSLGCCPAKRETERSDVCGKR